MFAKTIKINNENQNICKPCGGECCKNTPGIFLPEQILKGYKPFEKVKEKIKNKNIIINTLEKAINDKYQTILVIQPRTNNTLKNETGVVDDYNFGTCFNLTDIGCSLSFEDRPFGCQALIPKIDKKCFVENKEDVSKTIWEQWSLQAGFMKDLRDSLWDDFENKGNQNV